MTIFLIGTQGPDPIPAGAAPVDGGRRGAEPTFADGLSRADVTNSRYPTGLLWRTPQ